MLGTAVKQSKANGHHHHKSLKSEDAGHRAKDLSHAKPALEVRYTTSRCQHHPTTRLTNHHLSFRSEQEYLATRAIGQVKSALNHISLIHQREKTLRGKLHKKGCKCCTDALEVQRLGEEKARALIRSGWSLEEVRRAGLPIASNQDSLGEVGKKGEEDEYKLLSDSHIQQRWFTNQSTENVTGREDNREERNDRTEGSLAYNSDHEAQELINTGSNGEDLASSQVNTGYSLRDEQLNDKERAAVLAMERVCFDFDTSSGTLRPHPPRRLQVFH